MDEWVRGALDALGWVERRMRELEAEPSGEPPWRRLRVEVAETAGLARDAGSGDFPHRLRARGR